MTIKEYVGATARRIHRLGEWVEIPADVARSDPGLLRWCRRHANSELRSGAFRFAPRDWDRSGGDELNLPFLPEFDHADDVIRRLAAVEAKHRDVEFRLRRLANLRREAIAHATFKGYSRRNLGQLVGLSYARIQQLLADR